MSRVNNKARHGWALRKIFKTEVLRLLESGILILVFANEVNTSFCYMFFHMLYKNCM